MQIEFAEPMARLQDLETVSFTIPITGCGRTVISDGPEGNKLMWIGECDFCMELLYDTNSDSDTDSDTDSTDEGAEWLEDKLRAGPRPPNLRRVEWIFVDYVKEGFGRLNLKQQNKLRAETGLSGEENLSDA